MGARLIGWPSRKVFAVSILILTCLNPISLVNSKTLPQEPNRDRKPHIVIIVADDAGWNDFSFHGSPQIPTPNLDTLALSGVILNNYYASPLCTPSRGALMTGKHPIHIRLQHYVIMGGTEDGLPLEEKILPQYLKEFGYSTHLIGKWHLGHATKYYTPTYRGFDSHFGYWLGVQDYYDHFMQDKHGIGYDFRSNMTVNYDVFGKYSTDIFTEEAVRLIELHSPTVNNKPLFLMINHIAPHSSNKYRPQQAPEENINKFNETIEDIKRRMYAGVVDKLDESVGLVVEALAKNGMLNDTIIIFTSDNGGAPEGFDLNYGSNFPLRGVKNTLWEGGIRVAGFVWSSLLNGSNSVSKNLMHIQDWLPTLFEAIGEDPSSLEGIDGVSQWSFMKGVDNATGGRQELLHNIDDIYNNSAIRMGQWKLIQGNTSVRDLACGYMPWDEWYGPSGQLPNTTIHDLLPQILNSRAAQSLTSAGFELNESKMRQMQDDAEVVCGPVPPIAATSCDPYNAPCLFNIVEDPCEYYNLADKHPAIVNTLLQALGGYNRTATVPIPRFYNTDSIPSKWGFVWTNWKDFLWEDDYDSKATASNSVDKS